MTYISSQNYVNAYVPGVLDFVETDGSANMAIDGRFTTTPDLVHDGLDSTGWTASAVSGTWTFNSTTHAFQGLATVTDYTALSGDNVVINGTDITNSTLKEGVDWTAATSNDVTATNLALALNGVDGVTATATGAVVTLLIDTGAPGSPDITEFSTDAPSGLTVSAQSIDASATVNNDVASFAAPSSIDLTNFSAFSGYVYLDRFNPNRNSIRVQLLNNGVNVGNEVKIEDHVAPGDTDQWQRFVITKEILGVDTEEVDEVRITTRRFFAASPNYYLDLLTFERPGVQTFVAAPGEGEISEIIEILFTIVDPFDSRLANNSMNNLSHDKILSVNRLTNGIDLFTQKSGGISLSFVWKDLYDFLSSGLNITNVESDGTNTILTLDYRFNTPVVLNGDVGDKLVIVVKDDLSSFVRLNAKLLIRQRI